MLEVSGTLDAEIPHEEGQKQQQQAAPVGLSFAFKRTIDQLCEARVATLRLIGWPSLKTNMLFGCSRQRSNWYTAWVTNNGYMLGI